MAGLEKAGVQLVAENASGFFGDMNKASSAVNQFSGDVTGAAQKTSGAGEIMIGALRQVGTLAVNAFLEAGRAAVGFVGDSISAAGDFESGMNKFAAVAGNALEESGLALKDFRDQFIQIGKELPVSTAEVQQAAIEMVKGGIDPATIAAGGLKQVIQFAAAADLDLAEASTIAAKAIGGWVDQAASAEEKASFLAHSTDLLAKAANASTVNVDDLALGLYNVQGTAKLAGVSFDETVTALAQLAPSFSSSSDAGTSFKTFLARLQPSTKPAIEAMQALGLYTEETGSAFYDAQGNFVGMSKASQLLQDATKDLTEAQRVQLLQTIFGQDAIRTAAVFAEQGATGYNNMTDALAKQNSVAEMAAQKQAGFNTALDNFKGSVEALQITIGSVLLPVLTTLFNDYLAPGINTLTDLAGALSGDADAFARLSPTMQAVAATITGLIDTVFTLTNYITALNEDGDYLNDWLTHLPEPLQPIVAGFGAIMVAFQSAGDGSSALGDKLADLAGVWETLQGVIETVGAAYQSIIEAVLPIVQDFIEEHGDEIMAIMEEVWDTIILIVEAALEIYEKIIPPVLEAIAKFIEENGEEISTIISSVWTIIKTTIDTILAVIQGIIKATLALIKGDFEGAHRALEEMNQRVWNNIKEALSAAWDAIKVLLEGAWNDIKSKAEGAWNAVKGTIEGAANGIVDLLASLPSRVAGVGEAVMNAIWDGMRAVWASIVDWLNAQLAWFQSQLPGSEPKDPTSPLRGLRKRGMAIMNMLREGMEMADPLMAPSLIAPSASPSALLARGSGTTTNYNAPVGQRTANITYNTTHAPPVYQPLAIANALAGGS